MPVRTGSWQKDPSSWDEMLLEISYKDHVTNEDSFTAFHQHPLQPLPRKKLGVQNDLLTMVKKRNLKIGAAWWQDQQNGMCSKRRLRSAWASAQSDQSSLSAWRKPGSLATHWVQAKTLMRLGGCPGRPESSLGAHAILLVLSWGGSQYGHISSSSIMVKTILQGTVKGARRRGRQKKKRWEDNIKELTGMGFGDSMRAAEDSERWKSTVTTSSVVPRRPSKLRDWDEMSIFILAEEFYSIMSNYWNQQS